MDDDGNRSSVAVTPYGSSTTTTNYTDNSRNQYTAAGQRRKDYPMKVYARCGAKSPNSGRRRR